MPDNAQVPRAWRSAIRLWLIGLNVFLGMTAVVGAIWVVPGLPPELIQGSPFTSYVVPALVLGAIIGGGALVSAMALLLRWQWAPLASIFIGLAICIFEVVEMLATTLHIWLQLLGLEAGTITSALPADPNAGVSLALWLQPFYFGFGLVLVGLGGWLPLRQPRPMLSRSLPVRRGLGFAYVLSLLTVGLLVVTSIAGLWFGMRGLYRPDPATLPAFLGQDSLTLLVYLPLLLASMWTARRGSLRGLLVWLGTLFYLAYSYAYYLLSPEFNALYLAYVCVVSMSMYGLVYLLLCVDAEAVKLRFVAHTPARLVGGFMMIMALLVGAKWVSTIVATMAAGTPPAHTDVVVWVLDLAVALPALFWGGVWVWRRQPLGYVMAGLLLLKATSVGLTLVLDTYLMTIWGEAADPMLPAYAAIGLGGLALTLIYLRGVAPAGASPSAVA